MEELVISPANLDTIEKNLESVANELTGVINNVNSVNEQMSSIEENIFTLNDEVKGLVKEIRETTIINNARQNIMYNNEQIDKKYGYFDKVRRKTESLLDTIKNSNINKKSLIKLREELLLNNPNYWLSNALAALSSWLLNDKENTQIELNNALKKNKEKTSAFFCLVNLKLGRISSSINWLNTYLNNEDPTNLSSDFVTILDLVSNNVFGNQGKEMIINKINVWFRRLKSDNRIEYEEINRWKNYIMSKENYDIKFNYIDIVSLDTEILKNNLIITSSYNNILYELREISYTEKKEKSLDEILNNLIYEYESEEQIYQKDNFKNNLIIEYEGDREKALEVYESTSNIYDDKVNLLSLLTNIVMYKERYKISDETRKLSLSLIKDNIIKAYDIINSGIKEKEINIKIEDFSTQISHNSNINELYSKINNYVNNKFDYDDNKQFMYLIIIDVALIIAMIISLKYLALVIMLLLTLLGVDYYLIHNMLRKRKLIDNSKKEEQNNLNVILETSLAELIDYKNTLEENKQKYEELKLFLNSIEAKNYLKTNNERSIEIGE